MQWKTLKCSAMAWLLTAGLFCYGQAAAPSFPLSTIDTQYGRLPLVFEANRGQVSSKVAFLSRGPGYHVYLTSEGMVLSLHTQGRSTQSTGTVTGSSNHVTLSLRMLGATPHPVAVGEKQQPGTVNYFIGREPSKWSRNVPTYAQIRYKNFYRGIDLIYYGNQRQLEYDFEVSPGADPRQIRFAVQGSRHVQVASNGNLLIETAIGELNFQAPALYQVSKGQRIPIHGGYALENDNTIRFRFADYDPHQRLIIDPVLSYSTYLGGSGNEQVAGIAVDTNGNAYVVGSTDSPDFPLNPVGSSTTGNSQVFVAKLDATGSNLLFCDYLGGNSQDNGYGLALDGSNNIFVTGSTASSDFPIVNPFQGTYPGSYNAFLAKISSDGSTLLYSTYFGGNGSDVPAGVAVDPNGNPVIAGYTSSTNLPLASAYQNSVSPNQGGLYGNYGFVTKFTVDGSSLVYSTYLGGSSNVPLNCGGTPCWGEPFSLVNGLAVDTSGSVFVAGTTNTYNFPVTPGAFQPTDATTMNGSIGFVSKFGNSGGLAYSTYFGGDVVTVITAISVDTNDSAYVSGLALNDGTFPLTSTTICDPQTYGSGCNFAFVSKLDPTATSLVYSTFLGPNNYATPLAIALDGSNNAYVFASIGSGSFSSVNAIQNFDGGSDILLVEVDSAATTQLFATYLGGSGNEAPAFSGIAVDSQGNIYLAGTTDSPDFPVTQTAFQTILGGNNDAFVAKIAAASQSGVALTPLSLSYSNQAMGTSSQPQTVLLRNMGSSQLSISSISVTGDFSETDTCANGVPPAGSCTLSITFSPTVPGSRPGSVVIADDASGSPHSISLSGTGAGPTVSVAPTTLTFPTVFVGSSSQGQLVIVGNSGNVALTVTSIQSSGDFSQMNNCPASLPPSSTCGINVTFTPSATGARTGSLTISDNAPGSPHMIPINGVGVDFGFSSSSTTSTIQAGATATYTVRVSPLGGAFSNPIALSCTGAPSTTACSLSSASVSPGSNPVTVVVKVATTGPSSASFVSSADRLFYAFWMQVPGFGVFGLVLARAKQPVRKSTMLLALLLIVLALLLMSSCAGGTGIGPPHQTGTTPGTYSITLSGSSGALHHSLPLTLVVQ